MKVLILGRSKDLTWMLVNELRKDYPHLKIAIEPPRSKRKLFKARKKKLGIATAIGQALLVAYLILLRFLRNNRINQIIVHSGLDKNQPKNLEIQYFDTFNSSGFIKWISKEKPDVVVVFGTSILSSQVFKATEAIFLNIHAGITPNYRGCHGGYWAVFNQENDKVGVTIHVITDCLDGGAIVSQSKIDIDENDSIVTYPIKQLIEGVRLIRKDLREIAIGNFSPQKVTNQNYPIYYHPTIWQYILKRLSKGIK